MGKSTFQMAIPLFMAALMAAIFSQTSAVSLSKGSFKDNFDIMWSESNFKASPDGQIWYLSLDQETGNVSKFFDFFLQIPIVLLHLLFEL